MEDVAVAIQQASRLLAAAALPSGTPGQRAAFVLDIEAALEQEERNRR